MASSSQDSLLLLKEESKKRLLEKILDPSPAHVSQFPSRESEMTAIQFGANSDFRDTKRDLSNLELRKEERICFFGSLTLSVLEGTVECMGYLIHCDSDIRVTIHSPKWGAAMSILGVQKMSRIRLCSTTETGQSFEILPNVTSHASSKSNRLIIPNEWIDVAKTINEGDVVVTCGSTGVGKSTLNRYLINAFVSSKFSDPVLYVETDVGQSEMTPPGLISVHEIDRLSPLLGPPHTHISQPLSQHFYGANTPSENPDRFIACIHRIFSDVAEMRKKKKYSAVVVNTCGYVRGLGANFLATVIVASSPSHVLEIQGTSISKRFDVRRGFYPSFHVTRSSRKTHTHTHTQVPDTGLKYKTTRLPTWYEAMEKMSSSFNNMRNNGVKGKEARRLQLTSYFAPYRGTSSVKQSTDEKWKNMSQFLEIVRPVRTSLQSLGFCVLHENLTLPSSVLRAFDVSLVGLCISSKRDYENEGKGIRIVRIFFVTNTRPVYLTTHTHRYEITST